MGGQDGDSQDTKSNTASTDGGPARSGDSKFGPSTGSTRGRWSPLEVALQSVVKVFCQSARPDFVMPWQIKSQVSSTSSGFVVRGNRIICNAHGVTDQVFIRVRKHGDATKYRARLLATGHDCDLAILTVDSPKFWKGLTSLKFGPIPFLQDSVVVVGYPKGGDCISVTKGVVSRVVVTPYSHSGQHLLTIQIDAAINSGNSGGPALQGNQVVGVAFQGNPKSQNIGYIIPATVVQQFVSDVERNGSFTGIPCIGIRSQSMENMSLRKSLQIPDDGNGILVTAVQPLAPCAKVLRHNDVIRKIDGVDIAGDGTIFFRRGERLSYIHLIARKSIRDRVKFEIIRQGETLTVDVELTHSRYLSLVPEELYDKKPSYYVYAGLVFTILSRPYLRSWGSSWSKKAPSLLVEMAFYKEKEFDDQEVVILEKVLAAPVNTSYRCDFMPVKTVNGKQVRNLRGLVELVEKAEETGAPFIRFTLMRNKVIVVESKLAQRDTPEVLTRHGISHPKSADLRGPATTPAQQTKEKTSNAADSATNAKDSAAAATTAVE